MSKLKLNYSKLYALIFFSYFLIFFSGKETEDTFKIIQFKGEISIQGKAIKVGDVYPTCLTDSIIVSTSDDSGYVKIWFNEINKQKVILEKTIDLAEKSKKKSLFSYKVYNSRSSDLLTLPILKNYFDNKPFLLIGDCKINIPGSTLNYPNKGSYIDLYFQNTGNYVVDKIRYENSYAYLDYSIFDEVKYDQVIGPIYLTLVDISSQKEIIISEDFYVYKINPEILNQIIVDLRESNINNELISESVFDWLQLEFPKLYVDYTFIKQYVN